MALIHSQNWDGVGAPALPGGWTFDNSSYWVTTASPPAGSPSGANALTNSNVGAHLAYYATLDGAGGNVIVSAAFATAIGNLNAGRVFARGTSVGWLAGNCYTSELTLSGGNGHFNLSAWVAGFETILGSVNPFPYSDNTWYQVTLTCNGSLISAKLQRLSDGYWLKSDRTWSAGPATAIAVTDATVTGQGYAGLWFGTVSPNVAFTDDFSLSSVGGDTPPRPVIVRAGYVFRD